MFQQFYVLQDTLAASESLKTIATTGAIIKAIEHVLCIHFHFAFSEVDIVDRKKCNI